MNLDSSYNGIRQYPKVVQDYWRDEPNYLIEYDEACPTKEYCAVYFCSNDIWYPHTEKIFRKRIIEKNFFEWYRCRIHRACKHIFVRDVFKQWYLAGINGTVCSTDLLLDFLRRETAGYKVITLGSSAGGYASALFGPRLGAVQAICFNAQFSLQRLAEESTVTKNPLLYSMLKPIGGGTNILIGVDSPTPIFYVYSDRSRWDMEQHAFTEGCANVRCIEFRSTKHGIPFLKVALPKFINLPPETMERLTRSIHHPLTFTINQVGVVRTVVGFVRQVYKAYRKRH